MKVIVGTTPQKLDIGTNQRFTLRNVGPGTISWGESAQDAANGLYLEPGEGFTFTATLSQALYLNGLWVVSDAADTDLRIGRTV